MPALGLASVVSLKQRQIGEPDILTRTGVKIGQAELTEEYVIRCNERLFLLLLKGYTR